MTASHFEAARNPLLASDEDATTLVHTPKVLAEVTGISIDATGGAGPTDATTLRVVQATDGTVLGAVTETAPATDTASSGLNGRLQRIAQRLTSLIALLPASRGQGTAAGSLSVVLSSDINTVTANAGTNLNTSTLALETGGNLASLVTQIGAVTASPTANTLLDRVKALLTGTVLAAGSNIIGKFGIDQTTPGTTNGVQINAALPAGENMVGKVVGIIINPSSNFTRPADTTTYASGDLVANSVTAGSVAALSWTAARVAAGSFMIRRVRVQKSTASVTNASFRVHFYGADPTASSGVTNGDNGVWLTKVGTYLGSFDVPITKAFSDAANDSGVPTVGNELNVTLASGQTLYGLLEARAAYAPGNAEVFTVTVELHQY